MRLVANTGVGGSANGATTSAIDTTGANLLVLQVSYFGVSITVGTGDVSDSKGNTWVAGTLYSGAGGDNVRLFYCYNPTVGSGHTFSESKTGTYPSIFVQAFAGAVTSPLDQQNGSTGGVGLTKQPGSITPSQNDEIVITGVYDSSVGTKTINSGMTITNQTTFNSGVYVGGGMAYAFQTTAAAINPTWTVGSGAIQASNIASFKATPYHDATGSSSLTFSVSSVGSTLYSATGSSSLTFSVSSVGSRLVSATGSSSLIFSVSSVGASFADAHVDAGAPAYSLIFSASSVGSKLYSATGSSSLTFSVSSVGAADSFADATGNSSLAFGVAGTGVSETATTGSSSLTFGVAAVGSSLIESNGGSSLVFSVSAVGEIEAATAGSSSLEFGVAATGSTLFNAVGSSSLVFGVVGTGSALSNAVGNSSVVFSVSATSSLVIQHDGVGLSSIQFTVSATGSTLSNAVGLSSIQFTGSGTGARTSDAVGTASLSFSVLAYAGGNIKSRRGETNRAGTRLAV